MSDERPTPKNMPEDPKERWEKAREMARSGEDCDFSWWVFPEDKWEHGFSGITFHGDANFNYTLFRDCRFQYACFEKRVSFKSARFTCNEIVFRYAEFQKGVSFEGARFLTHATFEDSNFGAKLEATYEKRFPACTYKNAYFKKGATFVGSAFHRRAIYKHSHFAGKAEFDECCFMDMATFRRTRFQNHVSYSWSTFQKIADFTNVRFNSDVMFLSCSFCGTAMFYDMSCDKRMAFTGASADNLVLIEPPKFMHPSSSPPFKKLSHGSSAYSFAKQAAIDMGFSKEAGEYHYIAQCAINSGKKWFDPRRWCNWFFGRLIFGYGENPENPIAASFFIIWICAWLYQLSDNPIGSKNAWTSLYFSVVTFTTLGYGDMQPTGWMRGVAGFEALCGAGLMAAFVVVLSRKFVR